MHTQNYTAEKGIKLIELDGKLDQANMANQMENLVSQKVDGIIYCLLEGAAGSADINMAQEAGIPVITFAIKHDPETADATFVGIDEKSAGALGGAEAAKKFLTQFPDKKKLSWLLLNLQVFQHQQIGQTDLLKVSNP